MLCCDPKCHGTISSHPPNSIFIENLGMCFEQNNYFEQWCGHETLFWKLLWSLNPKNGHLESRPGPNRLKLPAVVKSQIMHVSVSYTWGCVNLSMPYSMCSFTTAGRPEFDYPWYMPVQISHAPNDVTTTTLQWGPFGDHLKSKGGHTLAKFCLNFAPGLDGGMKEFILLYFGLNFSFWLCWI